MVLVLDHGSIVDAYTYGVVTTELGGCEMTKLQPFFVCEKCEVSLTTKIPHFVMINGTHCKPCTGTLKRSFYAQDVEDYIHTLNKIAHTVSYSNPDFEDGFKEATRQILSLLKGENQGDKE